MWSPQKTSEWQDFSEYEKQEAEEKQRYRAVLGRSPQNRLRDKRDGPEINLSLASGGLKGA